MATEAEARLWLSEHPAGWDLAIVDLFLREGSGMNVVEAARKLPGPLWVVKSQIHAGGRGKGKFKELGPEAKGGVRLARSIDEVRDHAVEMLGNTLVTVQTAQAGRQVQRLAVAPAELPPAVKQRIKRADRVSAWLEAEDDERNIAWTRQFGDALSASSTGGAYVNYMANSDDPEAVRAAYEANFERLASVKRKYDPDDFFNSGELLKS